MMTGRGRYLVLALVSVVLLIGSPTFGEETPQKAKEKKPQQAPATEKKTLDQPQTITRPPIERRPETRRYEEIETIFERRGVLTPRGTLVIEPSLSYSFSSSDRVTIVGFTIIPAVTIGLIDVRTVDSHTFIGALAFRHGLTNRLELEYKIPYVYRTDTTTTRPVNVPAGQEKALTASGNDIGDVEFGLRYQINQPLGQSPIFIANLRAKAQTGKDPFSVPLDNNGLATKLPTGSGFWGVQPSLTAIYPSDPAVFFGSVSYLWNIERNVGVVNGVNYGTVDPGDAIGVTFGMGIALNEKASLSIGYDHSVIGKNTQNGSPLNNSVVTSVGTLAFGASFKISDKTSLNVSLGAGVTQAAPDIQFTIRVPTSI